MRLDFMEAAIDLKPVLILTHKSFPHRPVKSTRHSNMKMEAQQTANSNTPLPGPADGNATWPALLLSLPNIARIKLTALMIYPRHYA